LYITETTKSLIDKEDGKAPRLNKLRDVIIENGFEILSDYERAQFTFIEARKL